MPRQENVLKPGTGKKGKREELLIKEKKEKRKKRLAALDTTHSSAVALYRFSLECGEAGARFRPLFISRARSKRQRAATVQDLAEFPAAPNIAKRLGLR